MKIWRWYNVYPTLAKRQSRFWTLGQRCPNIACSLGDGKHISKTPTISLFLHDLRGAVCSWSVGPRFSPRGDMLDLVLGWRGRKDGDGWTSSGERNILEWLSVVFHNRVTISRGVLLCSEEFALKGANSFLEELAPVLGLQRPGGWVASLEGILTHLII